PLTIDFYTLSLHDAFRSTKTVLLGLSALGVICLIATYFIGDEAHSRFWSNLLHNSVFFTGVSVMALFFITVSITAYAGWHVVFKDRKSTRLNSSHVKISY